MISVWQLVSTFLMTLCFHGDAYRLKTKSSDDEHGLEDGLYKIRSKSNPSQSLCYTGKIRKGSEWCKCEFEFGFLDDCQHDSAYLFYDTKDKSIHNKEGDKKVIVHDEGAMGHALLILQKEPRRGDKKGVFETERYNDADAVNENHSFKLTNDTDEVNEHHTFKLTNETDVNENHTIKLTNDTDVNENHTAKLTNDADEVNENHTIKLPDDTYEVNETHIFKLTKKAPGPWSWLYYDFHLNRLDGGPDVGLYWWDGNHADRQLFYLDKQG